MCLVELTHGFCLSCLLVVVPEARVAVHLCNSALLRTIMKIYITTARIDSVENSSRLGKIYLLLQKRRSTGNYQNFGSHASQSGSRTVLLIERNWQRVAATYEAR